MHNLKKIKSVLRVLILASFFLVFFLLLPGSSVETAKNSGKYQNTIEYIDELIQDEMDDEDIVGLSIALVDDQEVIWIKGYGYSDSLRKVSASPRTVYRLGSISEIITSPAVMLLHEKGLIDINQPYVNYIPEFSMKSRYRESKPIKVSNLISHHSGIQSELLKGQYTSSPADFSVLLKQLKDEYVCYPPEFVFSFSKTGLSLLGILIERISKQDFNTFVEKNLFNPVSMKDSSFVLDDNIKNRLSKGYGEDEAEEKMIYSRDIPGDGLFTSVADLAEYMKVFFHGGKKAEQVIFKPDTVDRILNSADPVLPLDLDLRQGCGWVLSCLGENLGYAGRIAWHDDSAGPFKGRIIALLDHKIGVVVLSNTRSSMRSVQMIAVEAIKSALEEKKGIVQPEWEEPDLDDSFSESYMKSCEGDYATSAGVVAVTRKGDDLLGEVMGRNILLKPNKSKNFSGRILLLGFLRIKVGPLSSLEFSFGSYEGRDIIALHRFGERFLAGEKIKPFKVQNVWLKRLGNYEVINNEKDLVFINKVRLEYENGKLNAYYLTNENDEREKKAAIMPVSDTEAVILGLGRYMGETISIEKSGNEEILRYSGYKFVKKK
jgi:CubicO group peptidase (beta-lactamase class C family)